MVKNYIWDFDGTLYNSYPHITEAFCRALDELGMEYDYDTVFDDLSISIVYASEKYGFTEEHTRVFRKYMDDINFEPKIVPFDGMERVLRAVLEGGGRNYIYTHRKKQSLEYYLKKYGVLDLFVECVTSDNGFDVKPSPDAVIYLIEKYKLDPKATVMIGDREIDVMSGINAGTLAWRITGRYDSVKTAAQLQVKDISRLKI